MIAAVASTPAPAALMKRSGDSRNRGRFKRQDWYHKERMRESCLARVRRDRNTIVERLRASNDPARMRTAVLSDIAHLERSEMDVELSFEDEEWEELMKLLEDELNHEDEYHAALVDARELEEEAYLASLVPPDEAPPAMDAETEEELKQNIM